MRDEIIYKAIERYANGDIKTGADCCYDLLKGSVLHPRSYLIKVALF